MAEARAYYLSLGADNVRRTDCSLIPNCAGFCVLPQPFSSKTDIGREDYYLQYLYKGEMDFWVQGRQRRMLPGQAILRCPHTPYHYAMHGTGEVQYYWVHFTGMEARGLVERCGLPNQTLLEVGCGSGVALDFEGLFRDFALRDNCFALSAAARLTSICVEIGRQAGMGGGSFIQADNRISLVLSYIQQNYAAPLSIDGLAALAHLSPSRFRPLFKAQTGLSPMEYLTVLRLNHARQLLMQTDLSIGEIALSAGYPDQLYFSRLFRKKLGIPPSLYRSGLPKGQGS